MNSIMSKSTKKQFYRRVSLMLVISMCLLMLAGCKTQTTQQDQGESGGSQNQTTIDKNCIYREELLDWELPVEYVSRLVYANGKLYGFGSDYDEETAVSADVFFSIRPDGAELTELFRQAQPEMDENTSRGVNSFGVDSGENLYLLVENFSFQTPIGTGSSSGVIMAPTTHTSTYQVVKMDREGNEVWAADVEFDNYASSLICVGDKVLVDASSEVIILDADGKETGRVSVPGMSWIQQVAATQDGRVFVNGYVDGQGEQTVEIDVEKGVAGETLKANWTGVTSVMTGYGYDLFLQSNTMVAGYNIGDENYTEILNFVNSDIDAGNLYYVLPVGEGQFLKSGYNHNTWEEELTLLTKVAPEDVKDRQTITLGVLNQDSQLISEVVSFNKSNEEYRVTLKEYYRYNTEDNRQAGLTQLNNDIVAGTAPDVIMVENYNMPMSSYVQKGAFEDLSVWLDKDDELSREDLLANVLEAYSVDGKLCQIPVGFSIGTAVGKTSIIGDRSSWTISELREVMAQYPDSKAFDLVTQAELLSVCVMYFGESYLDPYAGTCNFNSPEFIELLEWAAEFPAEIDYSALGDDYWMNEASLYREDKVILNVPTLYSFDDLKQTKDRYFGEPMTLIGFPVSEGNGSVLMEDKSFAISAKSGCKEGAWEFIKYFLSEEYQSSPNRWSFPVRNDVLEAQAQKATEPDYYLDENGNKVEYENTMSINGTMVTIYPLTDEEAGTYLDFIRSVDRTVFYNEDLVEIILEECQGFFAGQKSAEQTAQVIQQRAEIYMSENQ